MKSWKWKYLKKLIKSVSFYEKRFLKSQTQGSNKTQSNYYSDVYEKILMNNENNEQEFKNTFEGKNISIEKAKFAKSLFTHLRNYHEDSSIEINLHNALCDIEILFTKQLYEFSLEVINYNIDISVKYQMYELTLQFAKWKRKCLSRIGNIKLLKNQLSQVKNLEKECYEQLNLVFQLRNVQIELFQIINKKGTSFDDEDKRKSIELLDQMKVDYHRIKSFTALAIYNEINSWVAYYVHNNNALALEHNEINYKLLKKSKYLIAVYPQVFLSVYYSFYKRSLLNNKKNTSYILQEIKELQTSKKINIPEDVRVQAFMFSSEAEILENINSQKFRETIDLFKENKKYLSKYSSYIKKSYFLINYYCLGLAHFHLKEYTQALNYTKKNIDNYNDSIRLDYYMYNLTLNFIIHIELGNFHIYKYLFATYKRVVKKHSLEESEEGIYIDFFQQIVKKNKPSKQLYLETYEALQIFNSKNNFGTYDLHLEKWFLDKYNSL